MRTDKLVFWSSSVTYDMVKGLSTTQIESLITYLNDAVQEVVEGFMFSVENNKHESCAYCEAGIAEVHTEEAK